MTAIGSGSNFVTAGDARQFDSILMTKTAGIEGTAILAKLPKVKNLVGSITSNRGVALLKHLSIMKEARIALSDWQSACNARCDGRWDTWCSL